MLFRVFRLFRGFQADGYHAAIEFFNGPHTINGVGRFEFLEKHLKWQGPRGK